jgi:anti-sigma factor RsiW
MARCEEIKLLLGPFEDGELEPHEMQEVARHVVGCADCEGELADYRTLSVSLRGFADIPDLTGFSASVLAHIEQLPVPLGLRIRRYLTSFSDGIGATIASGLAAAAVAVVTAIVLTPYFKQSSFFANHPAPARIARSVPAPSATVRVASTTPQATPASPQDVASLDANQSALPADIGDSLAGNVAPVLGPPNLPGDSGAIISRLEAESPSVAVWSAPESDTTVIWVPDQSR